MKIVSSFALLVSLVGGVFASLEAAAEIREAPSMSDVLRDLTPGTLVVFDLDNTVLESKQTLGTDQFFTYLVKLAEESGLRGQEAKDLALLQATEIQPVTEVRLVEKSTLGILRELQENNFTVLALTARPPSWAKGTLKQIASLDIDFSKTSPRIPMESKKRINNMSYQGGVIFLEPGSEKGSSLVHFINASKLDPKKIVFIDDKPNNVKSVDAALNAAGIENIEYRYGAADERVRNFDSKIASFQYHYFLLHKVFISDEKAKALLSKKD